MDLDMAGGIIEIFEYTDTHLFTHSNYHIESISQCVKTKCTHTQTHQTHSHTHIPHTHAHTHHTHTYITCIHTHMHTPTQNQVHINRNTGKHNAGT